MHDYLQPLGLFWGFTLLSFITFFFCFSCFFLDFYFVRHRSFGSWGESLGCVCDLID